MRSLMLGAWLFAGVLAFMATAADAGQLQTGIARHHAKADPRPKAWCGWFMRQRKGIADRSYNLARKWAQLGKPATGPAPGVVAVWRHHVGEVRDVKPGQILLLSGNDSRAVRERWRSVRGVIAWRWV